MEGATIAQGERDRCMLVHKGHRKLVTVFWPTDVACSSTQAAAGGSHAHYDFYNLPEINTFGD